MVLPFSIFEKLVVKLIEQRKAEEEIISGVAKYNSSYGPYLEMPLTTTLPDIISELYEDNDNYPTIDWWLLEGEFNIEKMENPKAKIWYTDKNKDKSDRIILTIKDLWEYMEEIYEEKKKCQKS